MAKISIITASYNREETIAQTMRSVNEQDYDDIEHIVIDGNSSDSTVDIVKAEGKRVHKLVSENDSGIYDAYNKGLALASGEVIGFMNSDDFYTSSDVISKVMKIFEDPEVEACHCDVYYVDYHHTDKIVRHWKSRDFTDEDFYRGHIPAHPAAFMRRSVYEKIGNFDTSYVLVGDYDLLLRAFFVEKVKSVYIDDVWIKMRTGGATGAGLRGIWKQNLELDRARKKHGINVPFVVMIGRKIIKYLKEHINSRAAQKSAISR